MKIPDNSRVQSIDLLVKELNPELNFYSHLLGLKDIKRSDNSVFLSANGAGPYLIRLTEDKDAEINYKGAPGLYHLALRIPNRKELARVFLRLFNNNYKFQGFADHLVSEAIYLADPEGNVVELYVDRPRDQWNWKFGEVVMDTLPLDISTLTNELDDREVWNGIHPETDMGHVHWNVSDLLNAEKFYNEILGLSITNSSYPGAKFFSAGGYHHHVGTNTWSSKKRIPKKNNATGMTSFTISIPGADAVESVKEKAMQEGVLLNSDGKELLLKDFDDNKVRVVS